MDITGGGGCSELDPLVLFLVLFVSRANGKNRLSPYGSLLIGEKNVFGEKMSLQTRVSAALIGHD